MAPVAAVEKFGLLVIPCRQIKLLSKGCEREDFPFSHGSAAAGYGAFKAEELADRGLCFSPSERKGSPLAVPCSVSDTVTALQPPPWQPQAGSLSVTAALFAVALGYFLPGVTAAATAYGVHPVLPGRLRTGRCRREGVLILHHEGVSFNGGGDAPISLESRLLDALVLSLLLPLWCEWSSREPQEKG